MTRYEYDSRGNMIKTIDPMGHETTMAYDKYGQLISTTDPIGNTTRFEYDSYGNLTTIIDPMDNKSIHKYDEVFRLISVTNPIGRTTRYSYNKLDKVTETIDPMGNITKFEYDQNGNMLNVTDINGNRITYTYDERNKLKAITDQLGNSESYIYDNNYLSSFTNRKGQTTTYTYDAFNRKYRVDYADGSYITYSYDAVSKLTRIYDSTAGPIEYEYESGAGCAGCGSGGSQDRIKREITPLGIIEYEYDALGRRKSMRVNGQTPIEYKYNDDSLLTDIIHPALGTVNIGYDDGNRRKSLTLPNGIVANYSYDDASRLLDINYMRGTNSVENITYTSDATGNRTSFNRIEPQAQLPEVANATFNKANQMLTFNDKNIAYDMNGNMISVTDTCGTTNYTWDVRNRLIGISGFSDDCQPLTASFKYDALNRRIGKTINGKTVQYLYDGIDIIQEIVNGVVTANYLRSLNIDETLGREGSEGKRYYLMDGLGSTTDLTDANGIVRTIYKYDSYGNTTITGEASDNPFQYTGRENDGTNLYYYRARYYNPTISRFISEDPIGFEGGINYYTYVGNNPVNNIDSSGKSLLDCVRFFYYAWKCAERGLECRKKIDKEIECEGLLEVLAKYDATYLSNLYFKACYQSIPRLYYF